MKILGIVIFYRCDVCGKKCYTLIGAKMHARDLWRPIINHKNAIIYRGKRPIIYNG